MKKKSLAAMQPQNFLKAINGQTVDSYSGFFVLSHSLRGREGCLTCVSLTQNCSDVGARCVCVCAVLCNVLPVSPYNCHQYVRWHVEAHRSRRSDSAPLSPLSSPLECPRLLPGPRRPCYFNIQFSICAQACDCTLQWKPFVCQFFFTFSGKSDE